MPDTRYGTTYTDFTDFSRSGSVHGLHGFPGVGLKRGFRVYGCGMRSRGSVHRLPRFH
jgi:hypothetical protein